MVNAQLLAVVTAFQPPDSAVQLVASLLSSSCAVVVSDDASPVTSDSQFRAVAALGADVIRHERNVGIARGLNDGLTVARETGAPWLLTLDQDSLIPSDYVDRILAFANAASGKVRIGAIGAEEVLDTSGLMHYPTRDVNGLTVTDELIQTGTLWSVRALTAIGGFDESLGIDAVDAAACVRLRRAGYLLALAPGLRIEHALGSAQPVRILGRTVLATGHSPQRRTTMVRNRLRLLPEELAMSPVQGLRSLRRLVVNTALAISVEDDRWAKAKGSIRGLLPKRGQ